MTPEQAIALDRPCRLAGETLRPEFRSLVGGRLARWSLVLTVNSGYE